MLNLSTTCEINSMMTFFGILGVIDHGDCGYAQVEAYRSILSELVRILNDENRDAAGKIHGSWNVTGNVEKAILRGFEINRREECEGVISITFCIDLSFVEVCDAERGFRVFFEYAKAKLNPYFAAAFPVYCREQGKKTARNTDETKGG